MAEALERAGVTTEWCTLTPTAPSVGRRLRNLMARKPALVEYHRARPPLKVASGGILYAHTYVADSVVSANGAVIVDWHNVESQYLEDLACLLPSKWRRAYLKLQARWMEQYEMDLLSSPSVTHTFCNEEEMAWARERATHGRLQFAPHQLDVRTEREANSIRDARLAQSHRGNLSLVYLGKLDYPPNSLALERFLRSELPDIVRTCPEVMVDVIGNDNAGLREAAVGVAENVRFHGYVADPAPLLVTAHAAVLPFATRGGTSVRVLYYAACGLPVVGLGEGFRGHTDFPTADLSPSNVAEALQGADVESLSKRLSDWYEIQRLSDGQWRVALAPLMG